ncbi:hypothetical protein Hypma_001767 [Hypsizygus marmoreus]|uniref:ZZ-type domain-containing protein n=1 Tax=Hypsizygus marmoreus TaxID=39966 RepID=A0A369J765_HYPMA|nr:hypothetical protein Hypma_001767 [Hypsizygus marmoreus]
MASPGLPNFTCDSCNQSIASTNPRIHCLTCRDYDLCANCGVGERFTNGHVGSHQVQVFKESGGGEHQAIPSFSTISYAPPSQIPTSPPQTNRGPPPPLPPRARNSIGSSNPATPVGSQWQPFFAPDMSPTATFVTLLNDIFTFLDPTNNGNFVPETFSRFLDDMGYMPHENSWKQGLQATFGLSAESMADKALKNAFDLFSIDHVLLQRIQRPHVDPTGLTNQFQRVLGSAFKPSMLKSAATAHSTIGGPMPAITRKGFIDIVVIEVLSDPSREWGNFSRLLKKYDLPRYRGWGDLPRAVLPAVPDPAMLQRVASVAAYAKQKGEREIEVARTNGLLQARANQAAIDIIDDTRYTYRYY